jgi:hypothetical protein
VSTGFGAIDLDALTTPCGIDLRQALCGLAELYRRVDAHTAETTAGLGLPCQRGCDACCHECVFLTPLEFLGVWDFLQRQESLAALAQILLDGRRLYAEHRHLIDRFDEPAPEGEEGHFSIARELSFRCPLLGAEGVCRVYPMRELYARLFGVSFNEEGGVYGCDLVGDHLVGKQVTLLRAKSAALALGELPLTHKRQVFPYYLERLARRDGSVVT